MPIFPNSVRNFDPDSKDIKFQTLMSVSYTHLRAHETVLDLVCRLLLEKKKHTTNDNNINGTVTNHNTIHTVTSSQIHTKIVNIT